MLSRRKQFKKHGHLSLLEKDHNDNELQYNNQSVKEISIQRPAKTKFEILYDKALFDNFVKVDEVPKVFMFVTRRGPDSAEVIDIVQ